MFHPQNNNNSQKQRYSNRDLEDAEQKTNERKEKRLAKTYKYDMLCALSVIEK